VKMKRTEQESESRLAEMPFTEEEAAQTAERRKLARYPKLLLLREKLLKYAPIYILVLGDVLPFD